MEDQNQKATPSRFDFGPNLEAEVERFKQTIGYQGQLPVSGPYYPYDDEHGTMQYPNPDDPGCYVFTSGSGAVLYVGKASRYLGNRVWAHIGKRGKAGGELYPDADGWLLSAGNDVGV